MVPASELPHGFYSGPQSGSTQELPTPIARSVSRSTAPSFSASASVREDGLDDRIRKSDLPLPDKRNVEIASDLIILDAIISGKWNNTEPKYLIQAGAKTGHGLFIILFLPW